MPLFALAIGFYWFRERPLLKHYLGTVLMVIGAIMVIGFDS